MPLYIVFIAIALLLGHLTMATTDARRLEADRTETVAIVGNMAVYRTYVARYAEANPTVTGQVADNQLGLPSWFRRVNGVSNYIAAGKAYVYYQGGKPLAAKLLYEQAGKSVLVGVKRDGRLYHPISGDTSIPIPANIPEGSVVYLATAT